MGSSLPVAIIGAGPVGMAAAAHLVRRGIRPVVLEQGPAVGHGLRQWAHVRMFSPWSFNVDMAAAALLAETGWQPPVPSDLPSGGEIVARYLEPLAAHPAIAPHIVLDARVRQVTRKGCDKMQSAGRADAPFVLRWTDAAGKAGSVEARAVIDASGTWFHPNPVGVDGLRVPGEREGGDAIIYGIPDALGAARPHHAGRRTLVVGCGHSAINAVIDLVRLREEVPSTTLFWAMRRERFPGGGNDRPPARGGLGVAAARAIAEGSVTPLVPYAIERVVRVGNALDIHGRLAGRPHDLQVDRLVVATGFRPDLTLLRELRVQIDPATEAPSALAPLIDPNHGSFGADRPHGAAELAQPEPGLYIVGAKSYGRAPTFLMVTGYEQVRSIAAALAGDREASVAMRLTLPEADLPPAAAGRRPAPASIPFCCVGIA